jgi:hypothetical protein
MPGHYIYRPKLLCEMDPPISVDAHFCYTIYLVVHYNLAGYYNYSCIVTHWHHPSRLEGSVDSEQLQIHVQHNI